ncbi:hypothetical protein DL93DRAFT_2072161 [Clavulina sp. PMI_390]|nr:hypothetical protein DL93DRAFT_2072161 [Clavulina sp. PMI_390]
MATPSTGTGEKEWTARKVRKAYIDYFASQGHTFWPSSSTIPYEDPTLLFANAGMNQYKPIFLGVADPNSDLAKLKRAANSQKCIRAGGKHNDLDDVGKDGTHLTFFEMLGNWSFGDYFKKEAIQFSWDLLTKVYKIPADRLYFSYFEGDEKLGLEPDLEAKQFWMDVGASEDHIVPGNAKDNFWEMGATGPCGPCSEIHYDHVGGRNAASLVNQDDFTVVEIWNNVFMQFNREEDGSLKPLPAQHIDTGMGFERLVAALNGTQSSYDTDVFSPIFAHISKLTGVRPYQGKFGAEDPDGIDTAYRVISDHARTLTFALCDGGVPSNVGRGYVLRRILRRGARYARKKLGVELGSFFSSIVPAVVEQQGDFFPEISNPAKLAEVKEMLDEEERSFARTLDRGEKLFDGFAKEALAKGAKELNGADVWRLYDTYGFPGDLTRIMAEELGLTVNEAEFDKAQAESKEKSKGGPKKDGKDTVKLDVHDIASLEKNPAVSKTDDSFKYGLDSIQSKVQTIYHNRSFVSSTEGIPADTSFGLVLDRTPFYAESGGQEFDQGSILIDGVAEFEVENVQVFNGYVVHIGQMKYGKFSVGDEVLSSYDELLPTLETTNWLRRWPIRNNHTGTHILNYGLREILGDHVDQKGSLVAPTKLRFDFSHKAPVTPAELAKIEEICSGFIAKNETVYSKEMDLKTAQQIPGLRAVFGEAYPDPVRVVSIGFDVADIIHDPQNPKWRNTSIEFCGGTHVEKTGLIKNLIITEEAGIAKGIRRVIAVTGTEAADVTRTAVALEAELAAIEKKSGKEKDAAMKQFSTVIATADISLVRKAAMRDQLAKLRKDFDTEAKALEVAALKKGTEALESYFKESPEAKFYVARAGELQGNAKLLQGILSKAKTFDRPIYILSVDGETQRIAHINYVPKSKMTPEFGAKSWAGEVTQLIGGRAGGKDESMQGVGTDLAKVDGALEAAKAFASKYL